MRFRHTLLAATAALALVACNKPSKSSEAQKWDPNDTPRRLADGRIEPTEAPTPAKYTDDAGRLGLIQKSIKNNIDLAAKYPPPVVLAKKVKRGSIVIDGKLDDAGWASAATLTDFKNTRAGDPAKLQTRVKVAWDDQFLYVSFDCPDTDLVATVTTRDGDVWAEDCAEIFLDADGDGQSYIELELSPTQVVYDSAMADYRAHVDWTDRKDLVHLDMLKSQKFTTHDTKYAAKFDGTLNNSNDEDKGWTCEFAVAWSDVKRGTNTHQLPPKDGDRMRLGLFRVNFKSHGVGDEYGAWNPTGSWFHVPAVFGHLIFVK